MSLNKSRRRIMIKSCYKEKKYSKYLFATILENNF